MLFLSRCSSGIPAHPILLIAASLSWLKVKSLWLRHQKQGIGNKKKRFHFFPLESLSCNFQKDDRKRRLTVRFWREQKAASGICTLRPQRTMTRKAGHTAPPSMCAGLQTRGVKKRERENLKVDVVSSIARLFHSASDSPAPFPLESSLYNSVTFLCQLRTRTCSQHGEQHVWTEPWF